MATEVEFTVAASDFPLGSLFENLPDAAIELDRVIPTDQGPLPYFWVWALDLESVRTWLQNQPALKSVDLIDEVDGGALFGAVWNTEAGGYLRGSSIQASHFSPEKEHLKSGYSNSVRIAQKLSPHFSSTVRTTVSRQRYHGYKHYKEGYYNDPRETTLEELGDILGISRPSVSARLQRGYRNLIGSTLIHESE